MQQLYAFGLFAELPTLSYNIKMYMDIVDMKDNFYYFLNNVVFFILFTISRICMGPIYMYSSYELSYQRCQWYNVVIDYVPMYFVMMYSILYVYWYRIILIVFKKKLTSIKNA